MSCFSQLFFPTFFVWFVFFISFAIIRQKTFSVFFPFHTKLCSAGTIESLYFATNQGTPPKRGRQNWPPETPRSAAPDKIGQSELWCC